MHLTKALVAEITRIGFERYPREACGVLLPTPKGRTAQSMVVEIPNRSLDSTEYIMSGEDIRLEIMDWCRRVSPAEREAVAAWHTHPGGNIGPSPGDMRNRLEGVSYLVVALDSTTRTGIPTWF